MNVQIGFKPNFQELKIQLMGWVGFILVHIVGAVFEKA